MICDVITFNGEYDLLEIRLNVLSDYVDQFVIVEALTTFSGLPKPLYFEKERKRFEKWEKKIKYFVIDENFSKEEVELAFSSPNTIGASHWKREFLQKESIKKALFYLKDDDICFIGDCDEIWFPNLSASSPDRVKKLKLKVYTYFLNNRSSEVFWGTIWGRWGDIKGECLNHLRVGSEEKNTKEDLGWHFTSIGTASDFRRKLKDTYTRESYFTEDVERNLEQIFNDSKDFLGRPFEFRVDESEWPSFLKENKDRYRHLCR